MREARRLALERLVEKHLLRRVRDVIVAANDVRDPHLHIVGNHREVVGGVTIGAQDDEVFDVGVVERDESTHAIVELCLTVWHFEAHRARRSRCGERR